MIKQTILMLIVVCFMVPLVVAAEDTTDDSMDVDDIHNAKATIPFGNEFFTMLIGVVKWGMWAGFVIGISIVMGKGPVAKAMNNANMSAEAHDSLIYIIKLLLLGAVAFLAGKYIFATYF